MDVVVYDMFLTCTRRLEPTSVGSLRLQTLRSTIHVYFLSRVLLSGSLCISILRTRLSMRRMVCLLSNTLHPFTIRVNETRERDTPHHLGTKEIPEKHPI
jgi:hypothetical protein